jgi:pimeloyl-ACP methyl ester carboxylesterase
MLLNSKSPSRFVNIDQSLLPEPDQREELKMFNNRWWILGVVLMVYSATLVRAQQPPYDVYPPAEAPYYRVRYEAPSESKDAENKNSEAKNSETKTFTSNDVVSAELIFGVNYTVWIPPGVDKLRGVIVHQHGCGEGSCKSGLTGAYDLHWQALAKKHACALLAPAYEQPEKAECQMWCDPRNGSAKAFLRALQDLGKQSGHPELAEVPWALWGHSGGGHWCGGMVLLYPDRVAAAWLRSGVPLLEADEKRSTIKPHELTEAALQVPLMCNLGVKEGVSETTGRFAGVWPANRNFFEAVRGRGGLIGVAVDPLTSHECGNSRYLAIPWLDAHLEARLSQDGSTKLRPIDLSSAWYSEPLSTVASSSESFAGDKMKSSWHLNERLAKLWQQYVTDTQVLDTTAPPKVTSISVEGNRITWKAESDLESGLAAFEIYRDGNLIATITAPSKNPFGRALFQGLQYSDTPPQPLTETTYLDDQVPTPNPSTYKIISINTTGLKSE